MILTSVLTAEHVLMYVPLKQSALNKGREKTILKRLSAPVDSLFF